MAMVAALATQPTGELREAINTFTANEIFCRNYIIICNETKDELEIYKQLMLNKDEKINFVQLYDKIILYINSFVTNSYTPFEEVQLFSYIGNVALSKKELLTVVNDTIALLNDKITICEGVLTKIKAMIQELERLGLVW